jgi:glycogen phosphorylase
MRALRSFSVRPSLPPALEGLDRLAMNLRWSWDDSTRDLFRWVDPTLWDDVHHDPVRLLGFVPRERLEALASDSAFVRYLSETQGDLERYLTEDRWFQDRTTSPLRLVAYFSPEFGISEAVPQYSGGLGVLAGDHLKATSDLGVPLVGVGLMYRNGYFRQSLSLDGWQEERFPTLDPHSLALTLCNDLKISVELAGEKCWAQVWRAEIGRTPLYLLDTDVEENSPETRIVTDRLYGGDTEHRLRQEMVLGIGGVRALRALGIDAQVFHTNEGHAGFLGLERAREYVLAGLNTDEALDAVRAGNIFTTHTPVPAGIDRFPRPLMEKYFREPVEAVGIDFETFYALGVRDDEADEGRFNMAVMGLRLAARSNAVARLHGEVSRHMFAGLWPDVPIDEVPITSITNGVHAKTWTAAEIDDLLSKYVQPEWPTAGPDDWKRVNEIRDDELWRAKEQSRERMIAFVRERLKATKLAQGLSVSDVAWTASVLDPKLLTVGFARRFATYKRATLLLSQPERLEALLLAPDKPVQFVFAGKAHPADDKGKSLIQEIQRFASRLHVRHRFVFIDDYDMAVARALVQGSDVWLNTPRRPQEACGTSGMKAALNGGLNCSILDGWWDEWFDGMNGWAISSAEGVTDLQARDEIEANSLFDLLEHQIVPMFYVRTEGPVPRRWMARVKHELESLGPKVNAARMVRDYTERLYEPAAAAADRAAADKYQGAKDLAAWKARVLAAWKGVAIVSVSSETGPLAIGETREVTAAVQLGDLQPDDVAVQLLHGSVGPSDELVQPKIVALSPSTSRSADGTIAYSGSFTCETPGQYGFTARVVPSNPALATPVELGRVVWAS